MNPFSRFWLTHRQEKAAILIKGAKVLDIGSRTEKIDPGAISIDLDRRFRPDVCASASHLPFISDSFDCVTILEVIEHLENREVDRTLNEIKRVSRNVVLSTPNCDSKVWNHVVWPLWSHTAGREWIHAHKQFYGKLALKQLLEERFGMEVLAKKYSKWNLLLLARTERAPRRIEQHMLVQRKAKSYPSEASPKKQP
jgi:predicted SAM-dependent methyltransferase